MVAQWNHCITYAKGEYLILASDDDVYHPEYLETFVPLIRKYPSVNIFRPRVLRVGENKTIFGTEGFLPEWTSQIEFISCWFRGYVKSGVPFYLFKRTALIENGGFCNYPSAWYTDDATAISMAVNGIVSTDKNLFYFRESSINISSQRNDNNILRKKLEATIKFYKWLQTTLCACTPADSVEEFYINESLNHTITRKEEHITYLLAQSKLKYSWKNYLPLLRNHHISVKRMMRILIKKFIF